MYRIYVLRTSDVRDKVYIYDDEMPYDKTRRVSSPKLSMEINSAGSLEFSFTSENIGYGLIRGLECEIGVEQNSKTIWFGRPISVDEDQWGVRTVHCEGALAYLLDGIYMKNTKNFGQDSWIESVTNAKNALWETAAKVTDGYVAMPHAILAQHAISHITYDKNPGYKTYFGHIVKNGSSYVWTKPPIEFEETDDYDWFSSTAPNSISEWYGKSYSEMFFELLNANGCYAYVRKSTQNLGASDTGYETVNTICIRRAYRSNKPREIKFGENLMSIACDQMYDGICSALYVTYTQNGQANTPLSVSTLSSKTYNNQVAYHTDETMPGLFMIDRYIERFGFIVKTLDMGSATMAEATYSAALSYIDNMDYILNTISSSSIDVLQEITVSALDLGLTKPADYDMMRILDMAYIETQPNRIGGKFPLTKIDITLDEPQNSLYTFNGTNPSISGSSSSSTTFGGTAKDNYIHPKYPKHGMGMYKFSNTGEGHVDSVAEIKKEDIEALGFRDYVHPSFIAHELGFYKIANTNEGHVNQVSAVTKEDIEALGIKDTNTTYTFSLGSSDSTNSDIVFTYTDSTGSTGTYKQKIDAVFGVFNSYKQNENKVSLTQQYYEQRDGAMHLHSYTRSITCKDTEYGTVLLNVTGSQNMDGSSYLASLQQELSLSSAPFKWVLVNDDPSTSKSRGNTQFTNSQVTVGDGAKENLIISSSATVNGSYCFIGGLFNETGKYCDASILYGYSLRSNASDQLVIGMYNEVDNGTESNKRGKYVFIIGNGFNDTERRNALAVDWEGNIWCEGDTISINAQVDANTAAIAALQNDTKNILHTTGGTMSGTLDTATNKTEITVPSAKSTSDIPTVVAGGSLELSGAMTANLPSKRSFVGSYKNTANNAWYDVISVRHRNGWNDGNKYGMLLYSDLTSSGDLRWNKQTGTDTWQGVRTLLDTTNYSWQMATELTTENLNDGAVNGICGQFYAKEGNTCKNTAVSGKPFFMLAIRIVLNAKMQVAFYPHNNALYVRSYAGSEWTAWRQI